jgi:hypothetical protein
MILPWAPHLSEILYAGRKPSQSAYQITPSPWPQKVGFVIDSGKSLAVWPPQYAMPYTVRFASLAAVPHRKKHQDRPERKAASP